MDEVDVGVRLQQVAPHPFARMGLAGDEQHPQLIAHAVDVDHRAVAVGRQFVGDRGDFEFDHIDAGVLDRRLHVDPLANADVDGRDRLAVAAHRQLDRLAMSALSRMRAAIVWSLPTIP